MQPKIENRSYAYAGENICTVSAVLNIYSDIGALVASTPVSASYNLAQDDFVAEVNRQLTDQVMSYLAKLNELDIMRQVRFPASLDFADAVNMIFDPIQAAIGGS